MSIADILAARRDGRPHTQAEIRRLVVGAADGSIPDYQLAAWLMAAFLRPLSLDETAWLAEAMADSGERMDLSALPKPWVDKHSTGGVGDKTTLVLAPLLAACGLTVVKMSGRGLGITGGTIDKLASVPGFRTDLDPEQMLAQAGRIGVALTGQTPRLAPADKTLYALRDATQTVASLPLIVSSILSKKIAGGAETVVLDVKAGSGSFMPTFEKAVELAEWLREVGSRCGLHVRTAITDMDQPLGRAVGNAVEVKEALRVLKGTERGRFRDLCLELAGLTLAASGRAPARAEGRRHAEEALDSGRALAKAFEWFEAQDADRTVFETEDWGVAPYRCEVRASSSGWVASLSAGVVGQV
ncbi:MAG: thymidine phosphorylase, partial [Fimbriimonadaceae bacterium]